MLFVIDLQPFKIANTVKNSIVIKLMCFRDTVLILSDSNSKPINA